MRQSHFVIRGLNAIRIENRFAPLLRQRYCRIYIPWHRHLANDEAGKLVDGRCKPNNDYSREKGKAAHKTYGLH